MEVSEVDKKKSSSNVFALAMLVGFFSFLLAGDAQGGLTDVQGFALGFFGVMFLYALLVVLASRQQKEVRFSNISLLLPKGASIKQTESENGVTIQIFVSNPATLHAGKEQ